MGKNQKELIYIYKVVDICTCIIIIIFDHIPTPDFFIYSTLFNIFLKHYFIMFILYQGEWIQYMSRIILKKIMKLPLT